MTKKVFSSLLLMLFAFTGYAQSVKARWVDSVFHTLSLNEKIGQLFMVPMAANASTDELESYIKGSEIGGIFLQGGSPTSQARIVNHFQDLSAVPLFIAQDGEWGPGASLDSTMSFPRALVLGALTNDTLIYKMGTTIARQLKMVGVNINFAPMPVVQGISRTGFVNYRSFGEDKTRVASKSVAFMRGLQDNGVLACAKNFPFEGITVVDVQKGQPVLKPNVDSIQVYPYKQLFEQGLTGVMPAASEFPLFYENMNLIKKNRFDARSLTSLFAGDWLKRKQKFNKLVFVDIANVQIMSDKYRAGEAELFAFQTGNDVLISSKDIGPAIRKIRRLVKKEEKYEQQLDESVRKILEAKFDAGLWKRARLNTDNLVRKLHEPEDEVLNQTLYQRAITVVRDNQHALPISLLEGRSFAYLTSDASAPNKTFYEYLSRYNNIGYFTMNEKTDLVELSDALKNEDVIIVGIFPQTADVVIDRIQQLTKDLLKDHQVIVCDFGHEKFLRTVDPALPTVVTAYVNSTETLQGLPQVLFGALPAEGKLPVTYSTGVAVGNGLKKNAIQRLAYSIPEDAAMDGNILNEIDSIAEEAIRIHATPGCQVWVARHGKVIYQKAFGNLIYEKKEPVTLETIYDLASVTKVSATLQTAMFMHERGLIDLNKKVSYYLPELRKTNKKDITLIDMLTHQSGLVPFIPMWPQTVKDSTFLPLYYSRARTERYPLQVAPNLFASFNIRDSVWNWIVQSKMGEKPPRTPYSYKYSDLGFLILQHLAEKLLNQPIDEFLSQNLYEPLGAFTTGFTPLTRFPAQTIAPTEDDKIFRKTFVSGTVHDERAAMMGGVAGHAGLFSNANDLGKLCQMLLQNGTYGGYQYYKPETVKLFTTKQFKNSRRGIGWDKPVPSDWNSPTSLYASPLTFGHTGFTGTCIWIDPQFDLVYIFLSNRVYPDRSNKLSNANIRSRIQDVIYRSIFAYGSHGKDEPAYVASVRQQ
jgi:CubicO group peptidase (beta-lactamase class C family)/beta-glucosidase-like glycosyl hydrolase